MVEASSTASKQQREADLPVFDFDYWMQLHEQDPQAFEVQRAACMQVLIDSAPSHMQPRLHGMMFEINHRRKHQSPMSSYLNLAARMWDKLEELQQQMRRLFATEATSEPIRKRTDADVLPFKSPHQTVADDDSNRPA